LIPGSGEELEGEGDSAGLLQATKS
jgi:hypothetical protein